MSARVWNLGLPRTGTTSVSEALVRLGYEPKALVAGWCASEPRWPAEQGLGPAEGVLLIATCRPLRPWLDSMASWRPSWSEPDLRRLYAEHSHWLAEQVAVRRIGIFSVTDGWSGLYHALSVASQGAEARPFPVLNQRSA